LQKVTVKLFCDLPHPKEVAATETIRFTLSGSAFELDTCEYDAKKMRATMAPFINAARPAVKTKLKPQARAGSRKKHAQVVRERAAAHHMPVGARGRIPARVEAAYAADRADTPAERAVMTVIQGTIDPASSLALDEPDVSAAADGAAAKPVIARKPQVGKPASQSTAKATAV
jgi:nucleoid-associated protein Lsr2